jgi:hypothetical protein
MKIISKNHSLDKGIRGYLVYLVDDNSNAISCDEVFGEEERIKKENELSQKYNLGTDDIEYVTLEKFKSQNLNYTPLILVFYLDRNLWTNHEMLASYGENVKRYLENNGDEVRIFFLPTDDKEEIKCINPVHIGDTDMEKIYQLIEDISEKFQIGIE